MKVKDLIKELQLFTKKEQELEIYLSSDEEGNSYSTIENGSINHTSKAVILYPWSENVDTNLLFNDEE